MVSFGPQTRVTCNTFIAHGSFAGEIEDTTPSISFFGSPTVKGHHILYPFTCQIKNRTGSRHSLVCCVSCSTVLLKKSQAVSGGSSACPQSQSECCE
jgi:hypothetical protein